MKIHLLFDLLSYAAALLLSWKWIRLKSHRIENETLRYGYYTSLLFGFVLGAFTFGTWNAYLSTGEFMIGKSVLGSLFGGAIAAELFKKAAKIKGSTGAYFVPSLSIGIAIGRIGCYAAGIEDYTYGIETSSIFGHDFGDGILRHPVQLYESAAMGLFFLYSVWMFYYRKITFENTIFYH